MNEEYCIVKDGEVINVVVSPRRFADRDAATVGGVAILRNNGQNIGDKYRDGKFYRRTPVIGDDGCPTGEVIEVELSAP